MLVLQQPALGWDNPASGPLPMRIVTHNIRYAATSRFKNEKPWSVRLPFLIKELKFLARGSPNVATFICLQEVLDSQLKDIMKGLNNSTDFHRIEGLAARDLTRRDDLGRTEFDERVDGPLLADDIYQDDEWAYIGVGRDNGVHAGEYEPVIFRRADWRCVFWRSSWLSATPAVPGRGWDAASVRVCTQGIFVPASTATYSASTFQPPLRYGNPHANAIAPPSMRHRSTGREVAIFATHLDDQGVKSRANSAIELLEIMKRYETGYCAYSPFNLPVAMGGDFNSPPSDGAYQNMAESPGIAVDVRGVAEEQGNTEAWGEKNTYTSFGGEAPEEVIDFVWIGPNKASDAKTVEGEQEVAAKQASPWEVKGYSVIPSSFADSGGVIVSDHRAVVADLVLH